MPANDETKWLLDLVQQPFFPEYRLSGSIMFMLLTSIPMHAVRIDAGLELVARLLERVDQLQGVLEMDVVVAGSVGDTQHVGGVTPVVARPVDYAEALYPSGLSCGRSM